MSRSRSLLAALVLAVAGAALPASAGSPAQPVLRIVTFAEGVDASKQVGFVKELGGRIIHDLKIINAVSIELPADRAGFADDGLKALPGVIRVSEDHERNWLRRTAAPTADFELPAPSAVVRPFKAERVRAGSDKADNIPWGIAKVNAPTAWAKTMGAGVKVAVVDTGIDMNHPRLKDNVRGGFNAKNSAQPTNFNDDNGHGTHVAGTIAAVKDGNGIVGVAPKATLYGIKVLDAGGNGTSADLVAGIDWAVRNGIDIANMSLGGGEEDNTPELRAAVANATAAGLTIIAAAGNDGPGNNTVGYPARYAEVIAVAAITSSERTAMFSSRGPQVAITAPGQGILSTFPTNRGGQATQSGTSMACPHAAGVAALAVAAKGIRGSAAIRAALTGTARKLPGAGPNEQGAGLVDAAKIVQ
ncbi:MAG: S8 family peptidase [Elusimicrobia bacterium]|nr:S8 family peptidase [Elusimicrobiota bacterium]